MSSPLNDGQPDAPRAPEQPPSEAGQTAGAAPDSGARTAQPPAQTDLRSLVIDAISRVRDPEIPVNIYDMGLIYDIAIDEAGAVSVTMTLTAPGCPAAVFLPLEVEQRVRAVPGVTGVKIEIVWDPPWTPERMSERARLQLGLY